MRKVLARMFMAAAFLVPFTETAEASLEPYQMVRSLQLVQDRIAAGDHAALPMQEKLLNIIDQRLRNASSAEFEDERNFNALLVYGLSGGNPTTIERIFSRIEVKDDKLTLAKTIASYATGNFAEARNGLRSIDPKTLPVDLAPPLALVAATVIAGENPKAALHLLDEARLLSTGTLIEEAALRRTIPLAAMLEDADRLASAAEQYVRRFLRSPYASQFADAFVSAVVSLHETVDLALIDEVASQMSNEQARVIYLRLARKSAIEGFHRLRAFASEKARLYAENEGEKNDPRAVLYANMASVSSENVNEVMAALNGIDRQRLSPEDRNLLDAARAIANAVLNRPDELSEYAANSESPPDGPEILPSPSLPQPEAAQTETASFARTTRDTLQAVDALLGEK